MRSTLTRSLVMAGVTLSMALPLAMSGTALATSTPAPAENCHVQPSPASFKATYAPGSVTDVTISYTGGPSLCAGISEAVSFNTYSTQGATWATSGVQKLETHQTLILSGNVISAHFKATVPAGCFYQTDAYLGSTRYDGVNGPLPKYPSTVVPNALLAARNGGTKVCTVATPTPTPKPTPVVTPKPTPVVTPTPTPVVTPTPTPGAVLSAATLPDTGAGDIAYLVSGLSGAAAYIIKRRQNS